MRPLRSLVALLAFPIALCAQSAGLADRTSHSGQKTTAATSPGPGTTATFRSGDSFELRMTGIPAEAASDYTLVFTVGDDGMINVPLGGQLRAAGLTQGQLEKSIERRLIDEKIFLHPTAVITIPFRYVTVGGNVRSPNRQPWSSDLTLLTAIVASGGENEWAGDKIRLIRNGDFKDFSMKQLKQAPTKDPRLLPGDRLDLR
jgi:polysaccharide export outer membrane protein